MRTNPARSESGPRWNAPPSATAERWCPTPRRRSALREGTEPRRLREAIRSTHRPRGRSARPRARWMRPRPSDPPPTPGTQLPQDGQRRGARPRCGRAERSHQESVPRRSPRTECVARYVAGRPEDDPRIRGARTRSAERGTAQVRCPTEFSRSMPRRPSMGRSTTRKGDGRERAGKTNLLDLGR